MSVKAQPQLLAVSNVRAWMLATPFTQCVEWSSYVDHMLEALAASAPSSDPTDAEVVWLRQIDAGSDNECWVVCSQLDAGATPFSRNQVLFA